MMVDAERVERVLLVQSWGLLLMRFGWVERMNLRVTHQGAGTVLLEVGGFLTMIFGGWAWPARICMRMRPWITSGRFVHGTRCRS